MKALKLITLIGAIFTSHAMATQTLRYDFDYIVGIGVVPPTTNSFVAEPWAYATFTNSTLNQVKINITSNLVGDEFISSVSFNIDPILKLEKLIFTNTSTQGQFSIPQITADMNKINAGAGTRLDLEFIFNKRANDSNRFDLSDSISYIIDYTGNELMTCESFNFIDNTNKYNAIAHVQSIGTENTSAWIGNSQIPEPHSAIMFGSLSLLTLLRRRK